MPRYFLFLLLLLACPAHASERVHALAMHGAPKYAADFTHLDYVNPAAPHGGTIHLGIEAGFDTLNPFILKGRAAPDLGLVFLTLMENTLDEPFSAYGQLAETVRVAEDHSYVEFALRPEARFSDGTRVTPETVIWSFQTLKDRGLPFYRSYYKDVGTVEKIDARTVRFALNNPLNRELPLILGQLPVLPMHWFQTRDFSSTTLEPPPGTGPYRIAEVQAGTRIVYERIADWWGNDLPLNRGRFNFAQVQYDVYRDSTVALEGLFAGRVDFRHENIAKNWDSAYDVPPVKQGKIVRTVVPNQLPSGMQGFLLNLRRPQFQDVRVRQALNFAFDFEWANKTLAAGSYKRTASYFENSELAARGLPSAEELALLEPLRADIPPSVFTEPYKNPVTDGSGFNRSNLKKASELLTEAGWVLRNGKRVNAQTGAPLAFTIIDETPAFDRWVQPYLRNLERLGIAADFQVVDPALLQNRLDQFDFDITVGVIGQSLNPGNEQREFWGSDKADTPGSRNLMGLKNKAVDALIEKVIHAETREELVTAVRALDRVLLAQHMVVPQWHFGAFRLAYWDRFGAPENLPPYGLPVVETWWIDPVRAAGLPR